MLDNTSNINRKKINLISDSIYDICGKEFHINSPKQLAEVLFDDLKLSKLESAVQQLKF